MEATSATWCGSQAKGPKVRVCYVCGRRERVLLSLSGYGISSYEIHLKQCKTMWEAKQQGLPASERKPLPKEPDIIGCGKQTGEMGLLDAQNEAATQVFNTESLETCEHCGRTFLEDRLKIHQKSCTSSSPAKPVGTARLSSRSPEIQLTTSGPRPQTSKKKNTGLGSISTPGTQKIESTSSSPDTKGSSAGPPGQEGDSLAGNYGGIASRGSRGLRTNPATPQNPNNSEQLAIQSLERRLTKVELELVAAKAEVTGLRAIVETLH